MNDTRFAPANSRMTLECGKKPSHSRARQAPPPLLAKAGCTAVAHKKAVCVGRTPHQGLDVGTLPRTRHSTSQRDLTPALSNQLLQKHLLLLAHALLSPGHAARPDSWALAFGTKTKKPSGCSYRSGALLEPDKLVGGLSVGGCGIVVGNQSLDLAALVHE